MKNSGEKRGSVIARGFRRFNAWLYAMAVGGFFGKIFTSYTPVNNLLKKSYAVSLLGGSSKLAFFLRKLRFRIAGLFDQSAFLYLWRRITSFLIGCRLRFYGSFFMAFGVYTGLMHLIKRLAFPAAEADNSYLLCAIILVLCSLPMILSRKPLAYALSESRMGYFIVTKFLGIPEQKLKDEPTKHSESYNFAIVAGLLCGALTYFVDPFSLIFAFIGLLITALILSYPEIGALLICLFLPFSTEKELLSLAGFFVFSYFIKLLRGKRILKIEVFDLALLIFGAVVLFGGVISLGGEDSMSRALASITALLACFVTVNVLRTKAWVKRCGFSLFASSFLLSVLLLCHFFTKIFGLPIFGSNVFFSAEHLFLGDRRAISMLLSVSMILTVSLIRSLSTKKEKTIFGIGVIMMLVNIVLIGDGGAIFGALLGSVAYLMIAKKTTVTTFALFAGGAVYAFFIIPEALAKKVMMFFDGLASALSATADVWQGHFKIAVTALFGGVGIDAFEKLYPVFSTTGIANSGGTESLLLRVLCDIGIVGVIIFAILIILFAQNCFEYLSISKDKESSVLTVGGICAVVSMLAQGMFFDVWSNFGMFYLFWFVFAITFACTRNGRTELEREKSTTNYNARTASIDLKTE